MKAFHSDKSIKDKYLKRVKEHQAADHLIRGTGWDGTKGCAVGCTLERYIHGDYETELGIPEWLARVEDALFEGMNEKKSRNWPEKFLAAIQPGADLEQAKVPFIVMVLKHTLKSMKRAKFDKKANPKVSAAIKQAQDAVKLMIVAQQSGNAEQITAARSAAESAARSAAESAAAAARSARSAAESAAESAWSAAWSARSAAWSARSAAAAAYDYYADELLKILKSIRPKRNKV